MTAVSFEHVSKHYSGAGPAAVDDCSLVVEEGQFVVLLGPSGCGKTTLLKMVNRLIEPTSGRIMVHEQDIRSLRVTDLRRRIGYVIQQVGLFPHMSVQDNIAVVPRLLHWPRARIEPRIDALLDLVGLPPAEYRRRRPRELSGGQQQRVGIARAMAADPAILLMDEPFGAIDAITRTRLQDELLRIQEQIRKTVLFVTHDVEEALRLADVLVVMRTGRIVQAGPPRTILSQPADAFVAELVGADDMLRQLSLIPVGELMRPDDTLPDTADGHTIASKDNLRTALSLMLRLGVQSLTVTEAGRPVGRIELADLQAMSAQAPQSRAVSTCPTS
ncbi:MAG TPA: ABC transporter ATP-binding protein [Chloroflexota bacterium]|nr:ABC transporter ATP-binding protein [Chloroflexota bacterium]